MIRLDKPIELDRTFPFDETVEKIIQELVRRQWEVNGVSIVTDKNRLVRINGDGYSIDFGWGRTNGPNELSISSYRKRLWVYDQIESGPSLEVVVSGRRKIYKGSLEKRQHVTSPQGRATYLVPEDSSKTLVVAKVFAEFDKYFKTVLKQIQKQPLP